MVSVLVAAGCVSPPTPAPLPDPIVSCASLGGPISYDPPADNSGADVAITAEPGAALADCTDNTANGISGASIEGTFVLPDFTCATSPAGTEVGAGTGTLGWSNGKSSVFSASFLSPGIPGEFVLELEVTSGLWAGATASIGLEVVSSVGDCWTTPVTEAVLASLEPFVLRPTSPPISGISQVASGTSHSCGLTSGGAVKCWGFGGRGELGDGAGSSSSTPVTVSGISDATTISQGLAHTCALLPGGSATCWGYNYWGSLGDGTNTNQTSPVAVVGLAGATSLAAGGDSTCALIGDGSVDCWGDNGEGQLGDGTNTNRNAPVAVLSGP